ncbi:MAG: septum formation initiator family protein [Rhodospirillales bacterium]|nr:septum formation initiator family protein [Alphaproteobacteria bacterium]MCB9987554.1 septum formation initiator family protein [Rhodospirillales bacterium]USO07725.1 MAG: septum formation initiator family protein [Rhodospirillales bacterium]
MKFRNDVLSILPVLVSAFVIAWCGFYLLFGANSIFNLRALKVQEAELQTHLNAVHAQRADIEDRVVRMRPGSLDWDLVEQEARAQLGSRMGRPDAPVTSMKM